MHRWSAAPFRRSIVALLTLALLSSALAASLAVHPFRSDDALLGVAIADEIAASFHDSAVVLGPEIAAGLVPPLVVVDGFVNLGRVLPPEEWTGPSGPQLVRSGTGVDVVVSGELELYDDRAVLRLELASAAGTQRAELSAPHDRRERLVGQAVRLVAAQLGLERGKKVVSALILLTSLTPLALFQQLTDVIVFPLLGAVASYTFLRTGRSRYVLLVALVGMAYAGWRFLSVWA